MNSAFIIISVIFCVAIAVCIIGGIMYLIGKLSLNYGIDLGAKGDSNFDHTMNNGVVIVWSTALATMIIYWIQRLVRALYKSIRDAWNSS